MRQGSFLPVLSENDDVGVGVGSQPFLRPLRQQFGHVLLPVVRHFHHEVQHLHFVEKNKSGVRRHGRI